MKLYVNNTTGAELTEREYNKLLKREYTEMWNDDSNLLASDLKEDGKNLNDFIEYMMENDVDNDFECIEK